MSNLPKKMPIDPVIVIGSAKISVAARGDEVATRGGDIAHRAQDRLDPAGREDLARDQLGGERAAAGRVDPQDDRADLRIVARGDDRVDQRLAARERLADQRDRARRAIVMSPST